MRCLVLLSQKVLVKNTFLSPCYGTRNQVVKTLVGEQTNFRFILSSMAVDTELIFPLQLTKGTLINSRTPCLLFERESLSIYHYFERKRALPAGVLTDSITPPNICMSTCVLLLLAVTLVLKKEGPLEHYTL